MPTSARRPGRPLADERLLAVAIPERGLRAMWSRHENTFVGDAEITTWAIAAATAGDVVELDPERGPVRCGTDSDDAILASLLTACGGRGVVLSGSFEDSTRDLPMD